MECLANPFFLQRQADAEGREMEYNTLPSYAMLYLMYKFSKATKGKIHF